MSSDLFDKRADLFRSHFDRARPFADFIRTGKPHQLERWENAAKQVVLSPAQHALLSSFKRKMNVLVLAGIWCGDCARQCPIVAAIAAAAPSIDCRFIDNGAHQDLADELRIHGASRVPVTVVLSEDFFEIARFGDRTLSTYRSKAAQELGPACDSGLAPASAEALAVETGEWLEFFERLQLMLRLSPLLRDRYRD